MDAKKVKALPPPGWPVYMDWHGMILRFSHYELYGKIYTGLGAEWAFIAKNGCLPATEEDYLLQEIKK